MQSEHDEKYYALKAYKEAKWKKFRNEVQSHSTLTIDRESKLFDRHNTPILFKVMYCFPLF